MTLTITKEENESRELNVTVEVEESRVQQEMRKTARKMSKQFNIPGFRKGKAPFGVVASYVGGKQAVRVEAVESMIQSVFQEMLGELEEEPYAQASFDDMEIEPLVLKFTIPLEPSVNLGDYRELRKEVEEVVITDEAVDEALERIQERHADIEEVDRPVALDDLVTFGGIGELVKEEEAEEAEENEAEDAADATEEDKGDDTTLEDDANKILEEAMSNIIFSEDRLEVVMDGDKLFPRTEFVNELVGMSVGEEKSFTLSFPDDYEDEELAGKEAEFNITISEVKKRDLPALDDELAKLEGDFETLDELKESVRKNLLEQAQSEAKNQLIEDTIDDILPNAMLVYPEAAVSQEIDGMVQNLKSQAERSGWKWEDFVALQGNTEDGIRENMREAATERLQRQLVLRQIVIDEKIMVQAEDVDAKIEERVEAFGDNEELQDNMRNYYKSGYGFDMISSEILMDKVHDRVVAILDGTAPTMEELEAAAAEAESASEEE